MSTAQGVDPLPSLPALPGKWKRDCLWVASLFLGCRLLVLGVFLLRGRAFPFIDADGYLRHAEWLAKNGSFAVPELEGGRFFSGVPLLAAMLGRVTGEFVWTGLALNALLGMGAALLFYRNVGRRDWALWHAALLPAWVSMTATLHSEAGLWCFALVGMTALRANLTGLGRRSLWVIAGYAAACRPTAFFIILPMLGMWLLRRPPGWRTFLGDALAAASLPLLLAAWTWHDAGHPFPQSALQAREFAQWSEHYVGSFPTTVFAWPGQAFVAGLLSPGVRPAIKLLNIAHLIAWGAALHLSWRAWQQDRGDTLAGLTATELAMNGAFILIIGGPFGHTIYYRFLATQANAFVLLAWLRHTSFPAGLWWTAAAGSVALASAAARGS